MLVDFSGKLAHLYHWKAWFMSLALWQDVWLLCGASWTESEHDCWSQWNWQVQHRVCHLSGSGWQDRYPGQRRQGKQQSNTITGRCTLNLLRPWFLSRSPVSKLKCTVIGLIDKSYTRLGLFECLVLSSCTVSHFIIQSFMDKLINYISHDDF